MSMQYQLNKTISEEIFTSRLTENSKLGNIYPEVFRNSECLPILYSPFQIWRNVVDLWRECSQHHLGLCGQSENIGRVWQNSPVCRDKLQCDWWLSFFRIIYGWLYTIWLKKQWLILSLNWFSNGNCTSMVQYAGTNFSGKLKCLACPLSTIRYTTHLHPIPKYKKTLTRSGILRQSKRGNKDKVTNISQCLIQRYQRYIDQSINPKYKKTLIILRQGLGPWGSNEEGRYLKPGRWQMVENCC